MIFSFTPIRDGRSGISSLFPLLIFISMATIHTLLTPVYARPAGAGAHYVEIRNSNHDPAIKKENEEFVGIRVVTKDKADEYNAEGKLTAIPATATSIGEGAYAAPKAGVFRRETPQNLGCMNDLDHPLDLRGSLTEQCIIYGDKTSLLKAPMLFVDEVRATIEDDEALEKYVSKYAPHGLKVGQLILFSHYFGTSKLQVVIPPPYLVQSPRYPKSAHGQNTLGLRVHCIPESQFNKLEGKAAEPWKETAKWQDWPIHRWPAGVKARNRIE
ncbi:hypothetical protein GYMLUDRAFT_977317 [Collybiopsis luxurians FD-317 M1]|nr:hypothetical protein GYMLUDRAFT_977317 [Collybiopsis luxurians FD-317 M1]